MRALVHAPSGRDAALICQLLVKAGVPSTACASVEHACGEMTAGAGVLIIAEEALDPTLIQALASVVEQQPPWSDFPLVLLTSAGAVTRRSERQREFRHPLGNVQLLERPVRPETMLSTIHSALRARRRQYEMRDQLDQYRRAEEALRRSEKLAIAGRLAASIAHEINNPLEAVTNLHYLMSTTASFDDMRTYLAMAQDELARVVEISKQTLKFHRESSSPAMVNLAEILHSVLALYAARLRSAGVEVVTEIQTPCEVDGFAGELRQLFANLVGNALDAMRSGGRLRIRVRAARRPSGAAICVTVADTGSGIAASVRRQLFEPFVSTKGNTGTGLGLWVAAEVVRHHRGAIRLKSRERAGTVFSVFLPRTLAASECVGKTA
jgi:signal transduction histidine kinase